MYVLQDCLSVCLTVSLSVCFNVCLSIIWLLAMHVLKIFMQNFIFKIVSVSA
jgi:hypothetical protein